MTKAAEKLCLTQSALSHQLSELESSLGFSVFKRLNRKLTPTDQGYRLIKEGKKIISEVNRSIEYAISTGAKNNDPLKIMVECYSSFSFLPNVLRDLNNQFPQTEVIVESSLSHDYEFDLLNERCDICLVVNKKLDDELEFHEIVNDRLMVVVSENNPLSKHECLGFESLKNETLITHCKQSEIDAIFEHIRPPKSFQPRKILQITSTESIINLVDQGIGVAVMSEWAVSSYCEGRRVSLKPFETDNCKRPWYLSIKKNATKKNQMIGNFIDLMKKHNSLSNFA